ncbi:MAG: hypothetical protein JXB26_14045 [Candidatus Aminicenantes bacterium]|nr:hypothetical protein [Candidatus Aminicenantes bacterium]
MGNQNDREPKKDNDNLKTIRVHPHWETFIEYCRKLNSGEIERLKIKNGLPLLAEEVKKSVMFNMNNHKR